MIVECDQLKIDCPAVFCITIANGSQLGNNAVVAKGALMDDGLLNVCLIRKYPLWYLPVAIIRLFTKTLHESRYHQGVQTEAIHVTHVGSETTLGQIDGEPVLLDGPIEYKIEKRALSILVPKK